MTTMTLRMDDRDAEIVRNMARFEGKSISDFIREAVYEVIEDRMDLAELRKAVAEDNGTRYTNNPVLAELGL